MTANKARQVWDSAERRAWATHTRLKPSEWAELYRVLAPGESDIPGPWRNENAPYLRGMMDLAVAPGIVQINVQKAGQIGVSEGLRNVILYWAYHDPDPMGLGLPDRSKGREIVGERLIPAFKTTSVLADLFTERAWDIQKEQIRLANGFVLHLMWAGSPSATSATPMRRVINDEVDKPGFRDWGGAEPNPIGRTWTRLRSYGNRKLQINVSTPTTRFGVIHGLCEVSDVHLVFAVPCPHCGEFKPLLFQQLRWDRPGKALRTRRDRVDLASKIIRDNAVWYECPVCGDAIQPDEKTAMVRAGRWQSEDGKIEDAEAIDEWPPGTRVAMNINALPCLWETWASIVAEFIRADTRGATYSFRTETLGEAWEEQVEHTRASLYSEKCRRAQLPEGVVPSWATVLLASIDTQHDHFYMVLRAWGPEMKSQRVWHGRVDSFEQLDNLLFKHPWPVEDGKRAPMLPSLILIDSGGTQMEGESASRTMQVYRWVYRRRARVRAIKGAGASKRGHAGLYIWPGKGLMDTGSRQAQKRRGGGKELQIWFLDTHHFGDELSELINRGVGTEGREEEELWLLNQHDDDDYNMQLSNVHKVMIQERGGLAERWVPIESGAADHYWDCEVYQIAAAYMAQVHLLPTQQEMAEFQRSQAERAVKQQESVRSRRRRERRDDAWAVEPLSDYV